MYLQQNSLSNEIHNMPTTLRHAWTCHHYFVGSQLINRITNQLSSNIGQGHRCENRLTLTTSLSKYHPQRPSFPWSECLDYLTSHVKRAGHFSQPPACRDLTTYIGQHCGLRRWACAVTPVHIERDIQKVFPSGRSDSLTIAGGALQQQWNQLLSHAKITTKVSITCPLPVTKCSTAPLKVR